MGSIMLGTVDGTELGYYDQIAGFVNEQREEVVFGPLGFVAFLDKTSSGSNGRLLGTKRYVFLSETTMASYFHSTVTSSNLKGGNKRSWKIHSKHILTLSEYELASSRTIERSLGFDSNTFQRQLKLNSISI
jgi:hypothetical protein